MTTRRVHPGNGILPPLSLPPGALAKTDQQHRYNVDDEPPNIEPIEHRIRLDLIEIARRIPRPLRSGRKPTLDGKTTRDGKADSPRLNKYFQPL